MNLSNSLTYGRLKLAYSKKGYKFFDKPYDMNVFGIRSCNVLSGFFDDLVGIAYMDTNKNEHLFLAAATTDPSEKWLLAPLNPSGCAILCEGQYRSAYKIGIHGRTWKGGGYKALEQCNLMRYIRDNTRDEFLDFDIEDTFTDNLKTNIHRASRYEIVDRIGSYSAGCQVIQDPKRFEEFIAICEVQPMFGHGNKFTYTLFSEIDFTS